MTTYPTRLRAIGLATLAVIVLAAPAKAQADQVKTKAHARQTDARKDVSRQWRPPPDRNLYGSAQGRCTWPYQNQFPPCMSTFPEGSPNYHGGRPGPTFDNE